MSNFWKHLHTTLTGVALAALQILANGRDWKSIGLAIGTAVLGGIAKDPGK